MGQEVAIYFKFVFGIKSRDCAGCERQNQSEGHVKQLEFHHQGDRTDFFLKDGCGLDGRRTTKGQNQKGSQRSPTGRLHGCVPAGWLPWQCWRMVRVFISQDYSV